MVRPVRIESDYIGNRDYLIAVHHHTLVTYRIDAINAVSIKNTYNSDTPIPVAKARYNTILHLRFHKLQGYEIAWTHFSDTFRYMLTNCEASTTEYTDVCMHVQDGQILLPLLRTFYLILKSYKAHRKAFAHDSMIIYDTHNMKLYPSQLVIQKSTSILESAFTRTS